jgi:Reprolysin family propeptide
MDGSRLHNFMDHDEINYFFGSDTELPEYEIVDLPENLSDGRESVVHDESGSDEGKYMKFKVFDKQIELHLHPNKNMMTTDTRIIKTSRTFSKLLRRNESNCHFLHVDGSSTAAISNCEPREIRGLIFLANDTLEIVPLTGELSDLLIP